ncbi:hypothetical protein MHU86_12619 [Fragilaria crotonensis]|nr:hypothetical protein MHU86_12619 [Fragilaria crotonensis]
MSPHRSGNHTPLLTTQVDIEDCPVADVPLTEIYDTGNATLIDDYLSVLKRYVVQQIEDTIWLDDQSTTPLFDAGFPIFHRKADGAVQSLRRPALQRLIDQTIRNRPNVTDLVRVEILIRFQIPISKLPRQSRSPPTIPSVVGGLNDDESDHRESQTGVSGLQSSAPQDNPAPTANRSPNETDLQFIGPPLLDDATGPPDETTERTNTAGSNFRGMPINIPEPANRARPRFDDEMSYHTGQVGRPGYRDTTEPRGPRGRLAFQAEDGGTPRTQFTHASGHTANSHAPITHGAESFEDYMQQFMSSEVKYKDFRKTVVQKYDSSRQDSFVHWYKLFCATCLQWGLWCPPYESVEPDNIHGCWWSLLPASVRTQEAFMSALLYGVLSQDTVFPVGSREHSALATTFVQYSIEIGRDVTAPPPSNTRDRYSSSTPIIRRIEAAPLSADALSGTPNSLGEQDMDLLVRAMSHNQAASAACIGCNQPGHTLTDCNRFVDYIVAESLGQRHPQLKHQVTAAHSQFRSRINMRNADGRPPAALARSVRSIVTHAASTTLATNDDADASSYPSGTGSSQPTDVDDDKPPDGYQLNALRGSFPASSEDFEMCFVDADPRSCILPDVLLPFFKSVCSNALPFHTPGDVLAIDSTSFLFRRLSETYDPESRAVFAHADNGSMACTTSNASLLFSYRPLSSTSSKVRLFDAGSHSHHPDGVDSSAFLLLLFRPSLTMSPRICHCAIAKQFASDGYSMTSSEDRVGMIRFPHRTPSAATEDICTRLQPTRLLGGLTFTDSLSLPSPADRLAPLPGGSDRFIVRSLLTATPEAPTP